MSDVRDLLRPLDELEPPELWNEASVRTPRELPAGPSRSGRVGVALVSAVVAIAGMVLLVRAFGDGRNGQPAGDVTNGTIAVAREGCDGQTFLCRMPAHIVLVNPDESDEQDIGEGSTPAWSPDGSRLAYTAGDAGAIYVVEADGTRRTTVVRCSEPDCVSVMSPTWSPDGRQLAFTAERAGRSGRGPEVDIWVVNADGTDAHAVTACRRPDCSSYFAPAWSPVGDEIAMWSMVRCEDGWGPSLRLLNLSTGDIRDVVSCVGTNGSRIAWSPDGRSLAFELNTGGGTGNVFTIPATGGSSIQITFCDRGDCRWAYYPSWSPDGRWVLFAVKSEAAEVFEVARARPDGGEFQRMGILGFMPAWQSVPVNEDAQLARSGLTGSNVVDVPERGETVPAFLADGHPVFVLHREDDTVDVVDAFSTHRPWGVDELVGWCPSSRTFVEREHGATFNEYGQYLAGPAAADLATFEVQRMENRVRVGSASVPPSRSENPQVTFQGELCEATGAPLTAHQIPDSAIFASPAAAVGGSPKGWIALRGVLLVRRAESPLLCATAKDGSCTSPAMVEGIDSERWLDFVDRSQLSMYGEWIARVEQGRLTNLTRMRLD